MAQENEKVVIVAELKPGIDLRATDLVTGPGEYWLPDENNTLAETGYSGAIPGNFWQVNGNTLEINAAGTGSEYWELDSTTLQIKT